MVQQIISMSSECKKARNMVSGTIILLTIIIVLLSMSSCGTTNYSISSPKVHIDGNKNSVHGVENVGNWQPYQFKK